MRIIPIILSGGSGTRLWPISRSSFPKQYKAINSNSKLSLLQETIKRIETLKDICSPIIVCNEEHRFLVAEQCKEINIKPKDIILEPVGKNTAPAILVAAMRALEDEKNANLLVLSSDHIISNQDQFLNAIENGRPYSEKGKIVLFGVIPNRPETGYGYIKIDNKKNIEIKKIIEFIEKPNLAKAKSFIEEGDYLWNSGIFLFTISTITKEFKKYSNKLLNQVQKSYANKVKDFDFLRVDKNEFEKCENISIDNALIEKTKEAIVIALDKGWSDIGNWFTLWQSSEKDDNNNFVGGRVYSENNNNCYLRSESRFVLALGLKDIVVVETDDVVLVGDIKNAQEIKRIVHKLKNDNLPEIDTHSLVYRPWGNYKSMLSGHRWQVKLISVKPGASLSLQMHHHRAEHWVVVKGTADVEIDGERTLLSENESIHIPLGTKHRLRNPGKLMLELIEVQSGAYLKEDDIVRFNDIYGRDF